MRLSHKERSNSTSKQKFFSNGNDTRCSFKRRRSTFSHNARSSESNDKNSTRWNRKSSNKKRNSDNDFNVSLSDVRNNRKGNTYHLVDKKVGWRDSSVNYNERASSLFFFMQISILFFSLSLFLFFFLVLFHQFDVENAFFFPSFKRNL